MSTEEQQNFKTATRQLPRGPISCFHKIASANFHCMLCKANLFQRFAYILQSTPGYLTIFTILICSLCSECSIFCRFFSHYRHSNRSRSILSSSISSQRQDPFDFCSTRDIAFKHVLQWSALATPYALCVETSHTVIHTCIRR